MKRPISAAAACLAVTAPTFLALSAAPASAAGSAALGAVDTAYTQDFDTLASSGTANTALPEGWWLAESGTSAPPAASGRETTAARANFLNMAPSIRAAV